MRQGVKQKHNFQLGATIKILCVICKRENIKSVNVVVWYSSSPFERSMQSLKCAGPVKPAQSVLSIMAQLQDGGGEVAAGATHRDKSVKG